MRSTAAAGAMAVLLSIGLSTAQAEPASHPALVSVMGSCHTGLVIWHAMPASVRCGYLQTPQVKIFDSAGRLRWIGSTLEAIEWAKAGMPATPIPEVVLVRDVASELRITHAAKPTPGHAWVAYYGQTGCEPCQRHLTMFRADVMPKLGPGTELTEFDLSGPGQ